MEKIAMRCTRVQYESIKEFVGELRLEDPNDFEIYDYLCTSKTKERVIMLALRYIDNDRKVYETFDKDIFLKACGIKTPKISINYNYEKVVSLTMLEIETILGYKIKIVK